MGMTQILVAKLFRRFMFYFWFRLIWFMENTYALAHVFFLFRLDYIYHAVSCKMGLMKNENFYTCVKAQKIYY